MYPAAVADLNVNELLLAYFRFAEGYSRTDDVKKSPTAASIKQTLRGMKKL